MLGGRTLTRQSLFLAAGCLATIAVDSGRIQAAHPQQTATPSAATSSTSRRALLDRYCLACHNDKLKTQGLSLQTIDLADVPDDAEVWEKVIRKLRTGAMPPLGRPRPDQPTVDLFAASLETEIDRAAAAR